MKIRIFTIQVKSITGHVTNYTTPSINGMTARKSAAKALLCPLRITKIIKEKIV